MKNRLLLALTLVLFSFNLTTAQEIDTDIEEVIVIGKLTKSAVEAQIILVEDDLYRQFNAKNGDSSLNLECRREVPTGTHFDQRVCEPRFLSRARQRNNSDYSAGISTLFTPEQLLASTKEDFDRLNAIYAKLIAEDAAFAEVTGILAALRARLNELQ